MHREEFLSRLKSYTPSNKEENQFKNSIIEFVKTNPSCFERSSKDGHITGSAFILDRDRKYVLLTHHRKLNKWLQPGGHADGESDILNVALREAEEETGLKSVIPISKQIFDIDIHPIPAHGNERKHLHYDIRFLFEADRKEKIIVSDESNTVEWKPIWDINTLSFNESLCRMVKKVIGMK